MHPLVGHEAARTALARARLQGTLPGALLLLGPRGVGKQRLALWLAQAVLCREAGAEGGCGACRDCRRVLRLEHPDLHWYFPLPRPRKTAAEKLGTALEEARMERLARLREDALRPSHSEEPAALYLAAARELRRRAGSRPSEGGEQVFIVGDADTLVPQEGSAEAANALLKLLEEPPPDTRFILTTSEPRRVLATIRSRTVPLHLSPLPRDAVAAFLEARGIAAGDAAEAARLSGGSVGLALGFLPDEAREAGPLETLRLRAGEVLEAALGDSPGRAYALVLSPHFADSPVMKTARLLVPLLDALEVWLRDLAAVAAGSTDSVVNRSAMATLERLVREHGLHPAVVGDALPAVAEARREALGNVAPALVVTGVAAALRRALLHSLLRSASGAP
ncbi:MAG: hypothetical protein RQ751_03535 [Longimicrobiales bacterium]|nr:hypothetical protein [Longimicrobiales bacterium]